MVTRNDSLWKSLDWVTICIYLLLIVGGWFSVCGASYDYGDRDFLDFSTRAGKQFVWIICSFGLGFVLLMLEDRMYDMFAYIIYIMYANISYIRSSNINNTKPRPKEQIIQTNCLPARVEKSRKSRSP